MVMMRVGVCVILIRMSPLTVTGKLRMRVTAVWDGPIDNVARGMGLDDL